MILTGEQKNVIRVATDFIERDESVLRVAGRAGCGKSVCLLAVHDKFPNFAVGAYTGKAASVLRRRGIANASTIHRLIYTPQEIDGKIRFTLKSRNEIAQKYGGFLIDEGSMITEFIYSHLLSFGLPIVFFGDHGQLEPVGSKFNLMAEPDIRLEKIHRNAGEIAHFAEWLRVGNDPRKFPCKDRVSVVPKRLITPDHYVGTDQVICAYNKTRCRINRIVRDRLGYTSELEPGDRVICLRNNSSIGVYNGLQGVAQSVNLDGTRTFRFETDFEQIFVRYEPNQFGKESGILECDLDICLFDYAYAITTHKCVSGDTILITENGYQRIDSLWDGSAKNRLQSLDLSLLASNGSNKAVQLFRGDTETAVKIKTKRGFQLTGSQRHPILLWDKSKTISKWELLPKIKIGDLVCISRKNDLFPKDYIKPNFISSKGKKHYKKTNIPSVVDERLGLILGYLVGDGNYSKNKSNMISLTTMDKEIESNFKKISNSLFSVEVKFKNKKGKASSFYFLSKVVRDYLEFIGLNYVTGDKKSVPHAVLSSPKSVQKFFLRGLFDTDGSASGHSVRLVNSSEKLLKEVQLMLLNFGVVSSLNSNYNKKYKKNYYCLGIYGNDCKIFKNEIDFGLRNKSKLLDKNLLKCKGKSNRDYVPGANRLVEQLRNEILQVFNVKKRLPGGLPRKTYALLSSLRKGKNNVSYFHIKMILEQLAKYSASIAALDSYKKIQDILNDCFYFDEIVSVEADECQMYDLSVPGVENFFGNGFVNHNSQGDEFDNVIVLEEICENWDHNRWAYTAASRAKTNIIWATQW